MNLPLYLDYNATTPVGDEAAAAMAPFLAPGLAGGFANPSSSHALSASTKAALATARAQLADLIGAQPQEIVFCSGGSESINTVLKGLAMEYWRKHSTPAHIITSAIEHVAVSETLKWLAAYGLATVTTVGVDAHGIVSADEVAAAVQPNTVLVTVMLANNETGAIQPISAISAAISARATALSLAARPAIHTDASQALGKIPVNAGALGVDFLTVAGHKLYAPKGVGATYVRGRGSSADATAIALPTFMHGASQEGGARAGTENIAYIAGLGAAAAAATAHMSHAAELALLRDRLATRLIDGCVAETGVRPIIHGPLAARFNGASDVSHSGSTSDVSVLPNTLYISFPGAFAALLLSKLKGVVACSAGAACHTPSVAPGAPLSFQALASSAHPSHVLTAMGVSRDVAVCTLRLSLGRWSTQEEVDAAAGYIITAVKETLAELAPAAAAVPTISNSGTSAARLPLETKGLYQEDTYRFSCDAKVAAVAVLSNSCAATAAESPQASPVSVTSPSASSPSASAAGGAASPAAAASSMVLSSDASVSVGAPVAPYQYAVVTDVTVAHPQGGGQPADRGVMVLNNIATASESSGKGRVGFEFYMVKPGSSSGSSAILHYGRFVRIGEGADPAAYADALPEAPGKGGAADSATVLTTDDVFAVLPSLAGRGTITIHLCRPHRLLSARLHSAGHVLDQAVRLVYAKLASEGHVLEPLKPGKGYHFADGPFVEYLGAVPPAWRDKLPALLNDACAAIIAAGARTEVKYVHKSDSPSLAAAGLSSADCAHLPDDKPVRIVSVGGAENTCPCGGTHVGSAAELGSVTVRAIKVTKGKTSVKYTVQGLEVK